MNLTKNYSKFTVNEEDNQVIFDHGEIVPITYWAGEDGEVFGWEDAIAFVAGPLEKGGYLTFGKPDKFYTDPIN